MKFSYEYMTLLGEENIEMTEERTSKFLQKEKKKLVDMISGEFEFRQYLIRMKEGRN